jgi:hypothetical protein
MGPSFVSTHEIDNFRPSLRHPHKNIPTEPLGPTSRLASSSSGTAPVGSEQVVLSIARNRLTPRAQTVVSTFAFLQPPVAIRGLRLFLSPEANADLWSVLGR